MTTKFKRRDAAYIAGKLDACPMLEEAIASGEFLEYILSRSNRHDWDDPDAYTDGLLEVLGTALHTCQCRTPKAPRRSR